MTKCVYVDTSVWILRIEGLPNYRKIIDKDWHEWNRLGWKFFVSEAVFLETLGKPARLQDHIRLQAYQRAFSQAYVLPAYEEIFKDAVSLVHQYPLKAMDALHLAFALHNQCDCFITTDVHFKNINVMPICWIDLSRPI